MGGSAFREMFGSSSLFRQHLVIPAGHGLARFADVMADFQREDFARIDSALIALASGHKPTRGRFWWERTKGASKDTGAAVCLLWLLGFSRRPLACQVRAADQAQADELRKAANAAPQTELGRSMTSINREQAHEFLKNSTAQPRSDPLFFWACASCAFAGRLPPAPAA
jgi:hypothetical protein